MALSGEDRTQRIYSALVAANPELTGDKVSDAEREQVKAQLRALFATDTTYLTSNAVVLPGTMVTPAGAAVSAPPYAGTVTGPSPTITGTGKLS